MRILVTGTRGIPSIPGGVETHCEALYPRLVKKGVTVTLVRRKKYINIKYKGKTFKNVNLIDLYNPRNKTFEAIIHTFLSVLYARLKGYKYIHIHAIGPGLLIPFARILGHKVVLTHHGPDYERQKWSFVAKLFLKIGEWCAATFANEIIVISNVINNTLKEKYNRKNAHLIYNAVDIPELKEDDDFIRSRGLTSKKYIIAVGRFVPEKGWHDLIAAVPFINKEYKIVFVGDVDHPTDYSKEIKQKAIDNGIILTGYITENKLQQIYSHAALFVLPSYHEGLPIALLEALSYNLKTVVSDIPANTEVNLPDKNYFKLGNINQLAMRINEQLNSEIPIDYSNIINEKYNWDLITEQTYLVYKKLMKIDEPK